MSQSERVNSASTSETSEIQTGTAERANANARVLLGDENMGLATHNSKHTLSWNNGDNEDRGALVEVSANKRQITLSPGREVKNNMRENVGNNSPNSSSTKRSRIVATKQPLVHENIPLLQSGSSDLLSKDKNNSNDHNNSKIVKKRRIYNDFSSNSESCETSVDIVGKDDNNNNNNNNNNNMETQNNDSLNMIPAEAWRELDVKEKDDIFLVPEYSNDIFEHLYKRELQTLPSHDFLVKSITNKEIYYRPSVRAILVDWLVEVHEKFQCFPETLYLSINLMDRFLSNNKVSTDKLQLVAVTSLFIAAKFEEIHLPKLSEYAYITAGAATKNSIKKAELFMLTSLNFDIGWPNPLNFLRRISKADDYNTETRNVAKFLLEYSICSSKFIMVKPSVLAAMAMYAAKRITNTNNILWDDNFKHYSGGIDPLKDLNFQKHVKALIQEISKPTTNIRSLFNKYENINKYGNIIEITQSWCKFEIKNNFEKLFTL